MRQLKLSTQILFFFTFCITVLFLLQLTIISHWFLQTQSAQTDRLNQQYLNSRASEIGSLLNQKICETRLVAQNHYFNTVNMPEILNYIASTSGFASEIYGELKHPFVFADLNGDVLLPNGALLNLSQREFFIRAQQSNQEYLISKPFFSQLEWQRAITIVYPVTNSDEKRVGYLLGALLNSTITDLLDDTDIFAGRVWIMDADGNILAEDNCHEHGIAVNECPKSYNMDELISYFSSPADGAEVNTVKGNKGLFFYSRIPYTDDWFLCVLVPSHRVYASLTQITLLTILIWLVMMIGVLTFSVFYVRHVTHPLDELAATMDSFDPQHPIFLDERHGTKEVVHLTHSFNAMTLHVKRLIEQIIIEQKSKKHAELQALQAQINPHFLYNTLDTISWKAQKYGVEEIGDIISALSQFFRISLSNGNDFITLDEEVEHVYSYLFIQQIRYTDRMDFSLYLDEEIKDMEIPKLILQPLVENALYHGIKPKDGKGLITVDIRKQDEEILIKVIDDGVGMDQKQLAVLRENIKENKKSGFGLFNIMRRLKLVYGNAAEFEIDSTLNKGTRVTITIRKSGHHV